MLVPPHSPMTREKDSSSWTVMKDDVFNGCKEDHFGKTSLHLSFTDYYVPLFDGVRGGQDSQVFFLESVVSVHDSGVWVGDIDVFGALNDDRIRRIPPFCCDHHDAESTAAQDSTQRLISVESWDGVLDPPSGSFVVRACGNWISRLAVTAILMQGLQKTNLSNIVSICPQKVCWKCNFPITGDEEYHLMSSRAAPSHVYIY